MGAVILPGKERYWWAGFWFFGGGYLMLTAGPWFSDTVQPQLATTQLLNYLQAKLVGPQDDTNIVISGHGTKLEIRGHLEFKNSSGSTTYLLPAPPFIRVGHCLFALLAGLLGGTVATWFHARRLRGEADAGQQ
jgi:hypothetical protein